MCAISNVRQPASARRPNGPHRHGHARSSGRFRRAGAVDGLVRRGPDRGRPRARSRAAARHSPGQRGPTGAHRLGDEVSMTAIDGQARYLIDTYLDFVAAEGVPVVESFGIDLLGVETSPWA